MHCVLLLYAYFTSCFTFLTHKWHITYMHTHTLMHLITHHSPPLTCTHHNHEYSASAHPHSHTQIHTLHTWWRRWRERESESQVEERKRDTHITKEQERLTAKVTEKERVCDKCNINNNENKEEKQKYMIMFLSIFSHHRPSLHSSIQKNFYIYTHTAYIYKNKEMKERENIVHLF